MGGSRLAAVVLCCSLGGISQVFTLSPNGTTVYDSANGINWLADANLPASNLFGLPLCSDLGAQGTCVNATGSMNYASAVAWVAAMNTANYLGHANWQLPTTPLTDTTCEFVGPNNASFGWYCTASALASLYNGLGLKSPNTAVPIPSNTAGPFSNVQPYLYWSQTNAGGNNGNATFSFDTGWEGANVTFNFMYVLPMVPGRIPGIPAGSGQGLQISPDRQSIYDPVANVTWPANANLAASNTFGLPQCAAPGTPKICVGQDGAMNLDSANQFIANMNSYNGTGYLGQTNWQLPPIDTSCGGYDCSGNGSPMGELFYNQLGLSKGMAAIATPDIAVGPFHNIQPYLHWSCQAAAVQDACSNDVPAANFEWSFSFGSGFQGTDLQANDLFVTAYYVGPPNTAAAPAISQVLNAFGGSATIASNTWVKILGSNLAPAGDSRTWAASDFTGNQMPVQLDGVSATVNGKSAFVEYISSSQVNVLTPPDAISGSVNVVLTNNGVPSSSFTAQAAAMSPSFFVFDGTHVVAQHLNYTDVGPTTLYPGLSTPAKPGEEVVLYANGFGQTSVPVVSGSESQSGTLATLPVVTVGGVQAQLLYAALAGPGEFQFNVIVPAGTPNGDIPLTATYNGQSTQTGVVITVQQ